MRRLGEIGIPTVDDPHERVVNIVASADLNAELDLNKIAVTLGVEYTEYEPEQFPGLIYRLDKPKVVTLLFGSGKIICTGARTTKEVEEAIVKISKLLREQRLL